MSVSRKVTPPRLQPQNTTMIVTVTLNPSLDRTLSVAHLRPGELHRAQLIREDLGGKGINVSRTLQRLDIPSRIVGYVGGRTGNALRQGLLTEGFAVSFIDVGSEIRQNITLLDESSGQYTKINELGPAIGLQHAAELEKQIEQSVQPGDLWAMCGSPPPGADLDLYARLIARVQERDGLAFLDTSGAPLKNGIGANPFALKINIEEAAELLGYDLQGDGEVCQAARELQAKGVRIVLLTRGAQGLVLAMERETVLAVPPPVSARSSVGAGDATLAGLLWAVSDRCDPVTTARRAVACGTAAAMQEGTGVGDRSLVEALLTRIEIRTV